VKILLADDEPVHLRLLEATVKHWGHTVTTATDGEEVWEILQRDGAPDLVVVDWDMPRLDGLELLSRVRADAALSATPVLLITVRASTVTSDPRYAQANGVLVKPWSPRELRTTIDKLAPPAA
jgi:CheY-like chemotaxis protein